MSLEKLQHDFIAACFNHNLQDAARHVKGNNILDAEQRIGIYRGSVHGILTQALEQTFPVCRMLLGDHFFSAMCDVFIDKHPPDTPYFADYGARLAAFLDNFKPAQAVPFVADMARLEWLRKEAWYSEAEPAGDFSRLMEIPESDYAKLAFKLNPSLQLFESNFRIDLLWSAHQYENQGDIDAALEQIDIDEPVKLAIWKSDGELALFDLNQENNEDGVQALNNKENHSEKDNGVDDNNGDDRDDGNNVEQNPDKTLWNFLHAIRNQASLEQLALQFGERLPAHLSHCIQYGWLQSYQICES